MTTADQERTRVVYAAGDAGYAAGKVAARVEDDGDWRAMRRAAYVVEQAVEWVMESRPMDGETAAWAVWGYLTRYEQGLGR